MTTGPRNTFSGTSQNIVRRSKPRLSEKHPLPSSCREFDMCLHIAEQEESFKKVCNMTVPSRCGRDLLTTRQNWVKVQTKERRWSVQLDTNLTQASARLTCFKKTGSHNVVRSTWAHIAVCPSQRAAAFFGRLPSCGGRIWRIFKGWQRRSCHTKVAKVPGTNKPVSATHIEERLRDAIHKRLSTMFTGVTSAGIVRISPRVQ